MSVKSVVNDNKNWTDFCEFVDQNFLQPAMKQLKQEKDINQVFRLQGKIQAYENIMDMRDTVNGR